MEATTKNNLELKCKENENKEKKALDVIETVADELTATKLKEAIIMSEIIGKPLSKRKGRRNR